MASVGPNSAGTGANATGIGTAAWTNPGNITTADGSTSTAVLNVAASNWLKATNFGFSLPSDATVTGIVIEVKKTYGVSPPTDNAARLVLGGTIKTTDRALAGAWGAFAYYSYGGSSDLWGESPLYSDINNSGFGFALSAVKSSGVANAAVDHVRATVYYTQDAAGQPIGRRFSQSQYCSTMEFGHEGVTVG